MVLIILEGMVCICDLKMLYLHKKYTFEIYTCVPSPQLLSEEKTNTKFKTQTVKLHKGKKKVPFREKKTLK